jgi:hypothetical protein
MLKKVLFDSILFLLSIQLFAQNGKIHGYIVDKYTNEKLIGATILDTVSKNGTVTNEYGYFSLTYHDKYLCIISYLGANSSLAGSYSIKDSLFIVQINQITSLSEVIVKGNQNKKIGLSEIQLQPELIKSIPVIMGEADIVKAIQLMPGVQQNKEGTSGFSVRGGSQDQNLFIIDGVPVYNINHLFGFFSVFSPDAINKCTFLKGNMPARYGGRLSSVIDLRLKEGNNEKLHGNISMGIIASKISLDGPIIKNKSTFYITARRTYIDLLSRPFTKMLSVSETGYYFQDYTLKTNFKVNNRNQLFLSFYGGNDKATLKFKDKTEEIVTKQKNVLGWGNLISALRWNSIIRDDIFSNVTLYYSRFKYNTYNSLTVEKKKSNEIIENQYAGYFSDVNDIALKWDVDVYSLNKHQFKAGAEIIRHYYKPGVNEGELSGKEVSSPSDTHLGIPINNFETALYLEDEYSPFNFLKINVGLRNSHSLSPVVNYSGKQPRVSILFLAGKGLSLNTSFNINYQYVHLLNNSNVGAPTDLWVPVEEGILPQKARLFTLGCVYNFNNKVTFSVEGYYKTLSNLIEIRPDAIIYNQSANWAEMCYFGEGTAKGIEFLLEKSNGKTTGWISYTLSKSEREFPEIDNGLPYPFKYDRLHNFSIMLSHNFNKNKQIVATWVYASGYYISLNYDKYQLLSGDGNRYEIDNIKQKNNHKTPPYHHLDINYSVKKSLKRGIREWSFGVYNLYSRINPFIITYDDFETGSDYTDTNVIRRELKMFGLFPIIPSISYSYIF